MAIYDPCSPCSLRFALVCPAASREVTRVPGQIGDNLRMAGPHTIGRIATELADELGGHG